MNAQIPFRTHQERCGKMRAESEINRSEQSLQNAGCWTQIGKVFLHDDENALVLFSDLESPRIKCPSVKERIAEPNKLTVRVSWETPEGRDTADGILTE